MVLLSHAVQLLRDRLFVDIYSLSKALDMSKVCLVVIDGWGVSEETRGELNTKKII